MVSLASLWLPILVSTVLVVIVSNLSWMVLRLHRNDWKPLPDEDALREALNGQGAQPGEYSVPFAAGPADWKDEGWLAKFKEGPVGFITLTPAGRMDIGKSMAIWFVYILIVETLVAYVAGQTLAAGTDYLRVFQIAGTAAILGFAGGAAPEAIWLGRTWGNVGRTILDGQAYGLVSAGVFGWLWPTV